MHLLSCRVRIQTHAVSTLSLCFWLLCNISFSIIHSSACKKIPIAHSFAVLSVRVGYFPSPQSSWITRFVLAYEIWRDLTDASSKQRFKTQYIFLPDSLPFPSVPEWQVPGSAVPLDWVPKWDKENTATAHSQYWHRRAVRKTVAAKPHTLSPFFPSRIA